MSTLDAPSTFPVTMSFHYAARNVIPPRCRKPRTVYGQTSTTVEIPMVGADAAPVAFRYADSLDGLKEWRLYDGALYLPYKPFSRQTEPSLPGSQHFPAERNFSFGEGPTGADGEAEAIARMQERYGRYLIVDGEVWQQAGEPRYVVMTFGLGYNHGGTSVSVADHFNSNIGRERYFRADEYAEAQEHALRIADERGDDKSLEHIASARRIEVLIPEAVTVDPSTHGEGDPFINQLERISTAAGSAEAAGFAALALAVQDIAGVAA